MLFLGPLYQPRRVGWGGRWNGGSKGRRYMYTYGLLMLRFDRKQQNSIKQLSLSKKINKFEKNMLFIFWDYRNDKYLWWENLKMHHSKFKKHITVHPKLTKHAIST